QRIENPRVGGSIPSRATSLKVTSYVDFPAKTVVLAYAALNPPTSRR
ncbi:MAG: hypothetical protein ACI8XO_000578, partial [Verrucomicrobiales bacterium]